MIQGVVKITASAEAYYPDGDREFDVIISKGKLEKHLRFYGNTETWKPFGEQLSSFPRSIAERIAFDIGSERNGAYLMLEAYCYDVQGHAALRIVMANNEEAPCGERLEFSIVAEAASLNILGCLLMNWQTENDTEVAWQAQVS